MEIASPPLFISNPLTVDGKLLHNHAMARRPQLIAWLKVVSLLALGLSFVIVDFLKSGGTLSKVIPQTPSWDKVNNADYVVESFLAYNIGNLLPWHTWGIAGFVVLLAALGVIIKQKRSAASASAPSRSP